MGGAARIGATATSACGESPGEALPSLQAAMARPPELKAIVAAHATHDRFASDVHYVGGSLHAAEQADWPGSMIAYNGLPPDPDIVGDRWMEMWLEPTRANAAMAVQLAAPPAPRRLLAARFPLRRLQLDLGGDPSDRGVARWVCRWNAGSARTSRLSEASRDRSLGPSPAGDRGAVAHLRSPGPHGSLVWSPLARRRQRRHGDAATDRLDQNRATLRRAPICRAIGEPSRRGRPSMQSGGSARCRA